MQLSGLVCNLKFCYPRPRPGWQFFREACLLVSLCGSSDPTKMSFTWMSIEKRPLGDQSETLRESHRAASPDLTEKATGSLRQCWSQSIQRPPGRSVWQTSTRPGSSLCLAHRSGSVSLCVPFSINNQLDGVPATLASKLLCRRKCSWHDFCPILFSLCSCVTVTRLTGNQSTDVSWAGLEQMHTLNGEMRRECARHIGPGSGLMSTRCQVTLFKSESLAHVTTELPPRKMPPTSQSFYTQGNRLKELNTHVQVCKSLEESFECRFVLVPKALVLPIILCFMLFQRFECCVYIATFVFLKLKFSD